MRSLMSILPAWVRALVLAPMVLVAACVAPTRDQVVTILTDAQWGLAAGCASTWVPAADCRVATDGLTAAIAVAKVAPTAEIKTDVVQALRSIDAALPADSRAHAYLNYLVVFLA